VSDRAALVSTWHPARVNSSCWFTPVLDAKGKYSILLFEVCLGVCSMHLNKKKNYQESILYILFMTQI